jgi:hypothetical protein
MLVNIREEFFLILVKHYAMKMYSGGEVPRFLNSEL